MEISLYKVLCLFILRGCSFFLRGCLVSINNTHSHIIEEVHKVFYLVRCKKLGRKGLIYLIISELSPLFPNLN
ncbi:hypothetical protein BMS3Abin09_00273 [bacterium BMS3Abin09]|nr:hypothetical protein BMS3Abin09_00273 [bacterium BMS3Abin09]